VPSCTHAIRCRLEHCWCICAPASRRGTMARKHRVRKDAHANMVHPHLLVPPPVVFLALQHALAGLGRFHWLQVDLMRQLHSVLNRRHSYAKSQLKFIIGGTQSMGSMLHSAGGFHLDAKAAVRLLACFGTQVNYVSLSLSWSSWGSTPS
jgi:hypothetical protein